ncbi:MAG: MFS transporter [Parachlamydiales bacterium]|nr:MFS transporter [Candidatus Acheromyda pituitae]
MTTSSARQRLAGFIGNILEHYDNALFGMLAPFIAPLFFAKEDPVTGLILTYGMIPLGIFSRPLGSLFFGWIGDTWGRKNALFISLSLMAFTTVLMGFLPTYAEVGIWAPALLAAVRVLQNFCAAGESCGGAIFVLEHTEKRKKSLMSSFYDASTIAGILLASGGVSLLSHLDLIESSWRFLLWGGSLTALIGVVLRLKTEEGAEFLQDASHHRPLKDVVRSHRSALLAIICVSGFSYTTYSLAVTLMNGYVPLITSLSKTQVMDINTLLLLLDFCLLPCFGYLAMRTSNQKVMMVAAATSVIVSIPLFLLLRDAALATVIAVRILLIVLGVAFSAPYHAWAQELIPPSCRYTIISLGYAIGSQAIGGPAPALSLWLYKKLGWTGAPALYLMVTAALAFFSVYRLSVRSKAQVLNLR